LAATSHIRHAPVRDWLYALAPYDKGSDHDVLLNSRYAIPSVFFFNWPHRYYHTDLDTPEKLDANEFTRTGLVAGTMMLVAATMEPETGSELVNLLQTEAAHALQQLATHCNPAADKSANVALRLAAHVEMEQGALHSVSAALPPTERNTLAPTITQAVQALTQWQPSESNTPEEDHRVPRRVDAWPANLGNLAKRAGKEQWDSLSAGVSDFEDKAIAALNYANGKRSVSHIARLVSGELGDSPVAQTVAWFDLLAQYGVIEWSQETIAAPASEAR
jgi:hypothetical protein